MNFFVLDVREPEEFHSGHVRSAVNIPLSELVAGTKKLVDMAFDQPIVVYCVSGARANVSITILQNMGYTNITNGINKQLVEEEFGL